MYPSSIHNWIKDTKFVEFDNGTEVTSKEFKKLQKRTVSREKILKVTAVLPGKS